MLKRWIVSPLQDVKAIIARQDAVEELVKNQSVRKQISEKLKSLPDTERTLTKIYTYSVKTKVKAFYIDMAALQRLDEFYELMDTLRKIAGIIEFCSE